MIDGGRGRKKERPRQMTSRTLSMDAREGRKEGRQECLIGCTDSKQAAAYSSLSLSLSLSFAHAHKDPKITRTTRIITKCDRVSVGLSTFHVHIASSKVVMR